MTLFDKIYEGGEALIKKLGKPLAEKQLKRRFEAFIDGCEQEIEEIELELHNLQFKTASFEKYDLNRVCELEIRKEKVQKVKKFAEKHQKEMFDPENDKKD